MNKARIITGDAIEKMRTLPKHSIDMVLCDLPFEQTANLWDRMIPFAPMWKQLERICKPNTAICLFGSQPFTSLLVASNPRFWKTEWIWRKNKASNFLTAKIRPMKVHEHINVFAFGNMPYYPEKSQGHKPTNPAMRKAGASTNYNGYAEMQWEGGNTDRYPLSVIDCPVVDNIDKARIHPTQKPVELLRYLIRQHSREGDTVLDFTCGSGSAGVAAIMENRDFIGIEKDVKLTELAIEWIKQVRTGGPLFADK